MSNLKTYDKKKFKLFLGLTWWSSLILLTFHFRNPGNVRETIPYGQYSFLAVIVVSLAFLLFSEDVQYKNFNKRFYRLAFFLVLMLFLSSIFGLNTLYGLRLLVILMVTSIPFILLGMQSVFIGSKSRISPIFVSAIFCSLGAYLLSITGPVTMSGLTLENYLYKHVRWSFLFEEANGLAWVLAAGITVTMHYVVLAENGWQRIFYSAGVLPFLFFVFWKTNSRASLLWVSIGFIFYGGFAIYAMFEKAKSKNMQKIIMVGLCLFVGLSVLLGWLYWNDVADILRLKGNDLTSGRMQVWLVFWDAFKNAPLLGFGFGGTSEITANLWVKSPLNVYIGVLGETGILGLISLLTLWLGGIWRCWSVVRIRWFVKDEAFHYAFFLMTCLIGIAFQQIGEWHILRVSPLNFLFFFLLAAAWSLDKNVEIDHKSFYFPL